MVCVCDDLIGFAKMSACYAPKEGELDPGTLSVFAKMRLALSCAALLLTLQPSSALRLPHGDRPSRRVALRTILALPFVPLPSFGGSCVCVTLTECVCEGPAATEGGGACT